MTTATCHTDGCPSAGVPVENVETSFTMDDALYYVDAVNCGACGQPITDIVPPLGTPDDELESESNGGE